MSVIVYQPFGHLQQKKLNRYKNGKNTFLHLGRKVRKNMAYWV